MFCSVLFIIIVSGLKIKPVLPYRQNLKKVQTYPPSKRSLHIHPGKRNATYYRNTLTRHAKVQSWSPLSSALQLVARVKRT